jgi:hypothetical protein
MKKLRLISGLLTLIFLVSGISASSVFAAKPDAASGQTKTITISGKKVVIDSAVTSQELSLLTPDVMKMFDPEGVLLSVTAKMSLMAEPRQDQISTAGMALSSTISSSQLYVITAVERITEKGTGYDNFKFTALGNWKTQPMIHDTDKMAMAWSDNFTLYSSDCVSYRTTTDPNVLSTTRTGVTKSSVIPEAGVSYDLKTYTGPDMTRDKTGILVSFRMTAKVYKNNSTGTANLVAQYAHKTIGLTGITVTLSASPSISFGGAVMYDVSEPAYSDWSY